MQESGFIPTLSGPPTRSGIAKGMWQFIPETGKRYGLNIGPYYRDARVDPADDRLNWEKATVAAASYIKDIYATEAQASGLLVMASYNWGERRVIDRLRKMPLNPRERNFWTLLASTATRCRSKPTTTSSASSRRRSLARTPGCSASSSTTRSPLRQLTTGGPKQSHARLTARRARQMASRTIASYKCYLDIPPTSTALSGRTAQIVLYDANNAYAGVINFMKTPLAGDDTGIR